MTKIYTRSDQSGRSTADPRADQWRPIATAPKDGTRILGFGKREDMPCEEIATVAWWSGGWIVHPNEATEYMPDSFLLTHWMSLPDPPTETP